MPKWKHGNGNIQWPQLPLLWSFHWILHTLQYWITVDGKVEANEWKIKTWNLLSPKVVSALLSSWVTSYKPCPLGFGPFIPFFLTGSLKLHQRGWESSINTLPVLLKNCQTLARGSYHVVSSEQRILFLTFTKSESMLMLYSIHPVYRLVLWGWQVGGTVENPRASCVRKPVHLEKNQSTPHRKWCETSSVSSIFHLSWDAWP